MQMTLDLPLKGKIAKSENIKLLLKELAEDEYKYDLRFWPDNKISLESIKKIADGQLDVIFHRIEYVIRKIIKSGGSPEQIYQVMLQNCKTKIKELSEHWWQELNNHYKKILHQEISKKNIEQITTWGRHASQCYRDYKMFCAYIGEKPQPEPKFIAGARQAYLKLKGGDR